MIASPEAHEAPNNYEEEAARLNDEAQRLFSQGHYVAAEHSVRQLITLVEQTVGVETPDFAMGLSMLGELRFLLNDLPTAESLFRQSLEIRGRALGYGHPDYAVSLACLGGVLWRLGALDEAERRFRQAMLVRYEALGKRHPESVQSRKELARLLRRRGNWAGALSLIQEAIAGETRDRASSNAGALSGDVVELSDHLRVLGEQLGSAAALMRGQGVPLPAGSVERLAAVSRGFTELRQESLSRIADLRVPGPQTESIATLQDLAALLDDLVELEARHDELESIRYRALEILDRVLALRYCRDEPFHPLLECQEWARQLRETVAGGHWTQLPAQTERLAEGSHALVQLLGLVENLQSLSDRSWADLHEAVRETLGGGLATAASRGRLISRTTPSPRVSSGRVERNLNAVQGSPSKLSDVHATTSEMSQRGSGPPSEAVPGGSRAAARDHVEPSVNRMATDLEPSFALLQDLAVASLVPTMGRVINLPADATSETVPHRLLRVGHAPAVVERSAGRTTPRETPAPESQPPSPPSPRTTVPPEFAGRLTTGHPFVEGIISGPLPLLQGFGQPPETDVDQDPQFPLGIWNPGFQRGEAASAVVRTPIHAERRSESSQ